MRTVCIAALLTIAACSSSPEPSPEPAARVQPTTMLSPQPGPGHGGGEGNIYPTSARMESDAGIRIPLGGP
jgi:hypothetical protein